MNFLRLENRIMHDEGFRAAPYLDTVNVPTIGYGTTSILGKPVTLSDPPISPKVALQLLRCELFGACLEAQALFTRFDEMNSVRQEILTNMVYNLGRTRLAGFSKMLAALEKLDYATAANEMVDSKWYRQVKTRGKALVAAMKTGEWI